MNIEKNLPGEAVNNKMQRGVLERLCRAGLKAVEAGKKRYSESLTTINNEHEQATIVTWSPGFCYCLGRILKVRACQPKSKAKQTTRFAALQVYQSETETDLGVQWWWLKKAWQPESKFRAYQPKLWHCKYTNRRQRWTWEFEDEVLVICTIWLLGILWGTNQFVCVPCTGMLIVILLGTTWLIHSWNFLKFPALK